jgi:ferrous iron transport protein B
MSQACETCAVKDVLVRMGVDVERWDFVVALAGNPNTGKSTVFNALTGLRQHTGNWPGKTVTRAEGGFQYRDQRYKLVDLPGTYSLLSASVDEEVARDFILFGRPDCTIVVLDATALERNLNLALQILEITDRVVVCLNLMDEARRKGIRVDHERLSEQLGVPVVPTAARYNQGLGELIETVGRMVRGEITTRPRRVRTSGAVEDALARLTPAISRAYPELPNARWVAMRLLDGDYAVRQALTSGELGRDGGTAPPAAPPEAVTALGLADVLQRSLGAGFRDELVSTLYREAESLAAACVTRIGEGRRRFEVRLDEVLTSRLWGLPIMFLGLALVFWVTVSGANVPSAVIASFLFRLEELGAGLFTFLGAPAWLTGLVWHGTWRGLAWVVAVMLPPMAIFFPIFTILEDFGYLPRVAFNLDRFFKAAGAHGKQALSMSMGFGCNAAGVIATRVIDSPRERLIAILTNNFVPCNGRFPTLIMLATIFVGAQFPAAFASAAAAGAVVMVVMVGVLVTLLVSAFLSRTVLKGEPSSFTLELPPYRRPNIKQILYTSLIDRTLFVLWRAIVMAAPAGALIWILSAVSIGGTSLTTHLAGWLDPLGRAIGLDGVILLAYVIAVPANEIVVPTILMAYTGAGQMIELESLGALREVLVDGQGWTLLTAVSLMLFSLLHNPCSTTIWTMWKETGSKKWTVVGALMPLAIAFAVCFVVANLWRLLAGL